MTWPVQWVQWSSGTPAGDPTTTPFPSPNRSGIQEIVYLPTALVKQRYLTVKGVRHDLRILVDGFSATARALRDDLALDPRSNTAPEFSYPLDGETTLALANQLISKLSLGRLIEYRTRREGSLQIQSILQYPYRVLYKRDRHHRISYRLTDLLTGKPAGTNLRQGLLTAFASRPA